MAFKHTSISFSLVFLATVTLLLTTATAARRLEETLEELCQHADVKSLCFQTLQGEGVDDPVEATRQYINELIVATNKAKAKAEELKKQAPAQTMGCEVAYDSAIQDLKSALAAIDKKDTTELMSILGGVISDFGKCEDTYVDGEKKAPLSDTNQALVLMVSNCLSLASEIKF